MELRQLKYFVTVAKTLNFSEASRKLYITQGTLSQQIRQLEYEVGSQLFDRTSHNVVLTEAGEELLPLAVRTLEDSTVCMDRMRDLRGVLCGTLNLGTTHSFIGLMTETIKSFLKEYPGINLKVHLGTAADLIDMLTDKKLDLVLAFKPIMEHQEIESEILFKTRLSAVMRRDHPLADHASISLEELEKQTLVLPGQGLQARRTFDRFVGIDTRKLNVRVEINDPDIIMDVVQGTNYITLLSDLAPHYRQNLVAVPIEEGVYKMTGCVHRLKDGYRKRSADVFLEKLRDSAQIERLCRNLEM